MKRLSVLVICVLFFSLGFFEPVAIAGDVNIDVVNEQNQKQVDNSSHEQSITFGDSKGSVEHLPVNNPAPNVGLISPYYKDERYKVWFSPYWSSIAFSQMKELKQRKGKVHVYAWKSLEKNDDPMLILSKYPEDIEFRELGYAYVSGQEGMEVLEPTVMRALYYGRKKTQARYALVLVRERAETVGKNRAIGSAFVLGAALGPSNAPGELVASGAGGVGYGKARAWYEINYGVKVVFFDLPNGTKAVKAQKKEALAVADQKQTEQLVEKKEVLILEESLEDKDWSAELTELNTIYYDTDQDKLLDSLKEAQVSGQQKNLEDNIAYLVENWQKIVASSYKIWFVGYCDYRATEKHNNDLGMRRAKKLAQEAARQLAEAGLNESEISDKIKYLSAGEEFPYSDELWQNRSVGIVRGEIITRY